MGLTDRGGELDEETKTGKEPKTMTNNFVKKAGRGDNKTDIEKYTRGKCGRGQSASPLAPCSSCSRQGGTRNRQSLTRPRASCVEKLAALRQLNNFNFDFKANDPDRRLRVQAIIEQTVGDAKSRIEMNKFHDYMENANVDIEDFNRKRTSMIEATKRIKETFYDRRDSQIKEECGYDVRAESLKEELIRKKLMQGDSGGKSPHAASLRPSDSPMSRESPAASTDRLWWLPCARAISPGQKGSLFGTHD